MELLYGSKLLPGFSIISHGCAKHGKACTIYRWQHASNSKQLHFAPGCTAVYTLADDSEVHLQQIEKLEKQLFAKSDGWRGSIFKQELKKRNTVMLYAVRTVASLTQATLPADSARPCSLKEWPQQQQHHSLQQPASSTVLGYIVVQVHSVVAHINKLAVAPHARRQGLGAALLRAALWQATAERRVLCSTLHVDASNTAALELYKKAGFQQDGVIQDYYGTGKPALKLLADLQESPAVAGFMQR